MIVIELAKPVDLNMAILELLFDLEYVLFVCYRTNVSFSIRISF